MSTHSHTVRKLGEFAKSTGASVFRDVIATRRQNLRSTTETVVLLVESRDEVHVALKSELEETGFTVQLAGAGSDVMPQVLRRSPDIVLVSESLPDESCWLITKKLRIAGRRMPIWVYASRPSRCWNAWKEFSGADQILHYGGDLLRLSAMLRRRLARLFLNQNRNETAPNMVLSLPAAASRPSAEFLGSPAPRSLSHAP